MAAFGLLAARRIHTLHSTALVIEMVARLNHGEEEGKRMWSGSLGSRHTTTLDEKDRLSEHLQFTPLLLEQD